MLSLTSPTEKKYIEIQINATQPSSLTKAEGNNTCFVFSELGLTYAKFNSLKSQN